MKTKKMITQIAAFGLMATLADGATLRYNGSGNWNDVSNNDSGWGEKGEVSEVE
ncbi:MAG: hypothetical protein ACSHYF_03060 [Verrucomicrobiaceae bacterium]